MVINGLQKLTLLDFPGRLSCTVFTGGCNFRCPFCHNASLVLGKEPQIDTGEVLDFLKKRQNVLDGVCISGGEPLIQDDIDAFLREIKGLNYSIKLDTNGSLPEKLVSLCEEGLIDYVAMDIKSSLSNYEKATGVSGFNIKSIMKSASYLMNAGLSYEFRTTVAAPLHSFDDFESIAMWLAGAKKYFLQSFIDSGNLLGQGLSPFTAADMQKVLQILQKTIPNAEIRTA